MAKALHAVEYLAAPEKHPPRPVCALFGDEPFLKRQASARLREVALGGGDGDFSRATFDGGTVQFRDVIDELSTVAMFGGDKRLVVVDDADDFVTRYRAQLEDYVARPKTTGILILMVKTWPANTRLAKAVAKEGLAIDCSAPQAGQLTRWLASWAKQAHGAQLAASTAELLIEMVGPELGMLDQEIAKLAVTVGPGGKITADVVKNCVGTWRAKTTWQMLDLALAGDVAEALVQLDRLLLAGENPIGLLGQIAAPLRRLAAATRLILQAEASGRPISLSAALQRAGVKSFVLRKAEQQLRQLGRHRGARLYDWLLQADLDLKGASSVPPRLVLERLLIRLAAREARALVNN